MVLYTMVTGRMPFDDSEVKLLLQQIKKGVTFHKPKQQISESCKDLIRSMLILDFKARIAVEDIESHPWFTDNLSSRKPRTSSGPSGQPCCSLSTSENVS